MKSIITAGAIAFAGMYASAPAFAAGPCPAGHTCSTVAVPQPPNTKVGPSTMVVPKGGFNVPTTPVKMNTDGTVNHGTIRSPVADAGRASYCRSNPRACGER